MTRLFAAILLALVAAGLQAQTYPSRLVRIVSPFPTGISPDTAARLVAERLSQAWGQQVLLEPRPGASGFIALGAARKAAPDVPTSPEAGGPAGYEVESWTGMLAPRGTPPELARRLSSDIAAALRDAELGERFRNLGLEPVSSTSAEMAELIRDNLARNGELVKRAGIRPE
jgi:tripartite-type tricarboxylate transporter receptor subunit TctC